MKSSKPSSPAYEARNTTQGELALIGYSAGNFGKNLLLSSVDISLLFLLTDLLGIPATAASVLMLVVFVGDLLFDVAAGYLVSVGQLKGIGYRRFIAFGAAPCAASFALVFSLPALGSSRQTRGDAGL